mgnify:CR=1 FL=1|jgi:hypothetical protein
MSNKRLPPDEWAAARVAWEADPTLSFYALAARLGVDKAAVSRRAKREGWERPANLAELAKKAHARADRMAAEAQLAVQVERSSPPKSPDGDVGDEDGDVAEVTQVTAVNVTPGATKKDQSDPPPTEQAETREEPAKPAKPPHDPAVVQDVAVKLRAEIADRHRKEWQAARKLSYEAIQAKDFERAKLAKITSETIKIIQEGERKAWGLDAADPQAGPSVVVIERSGAGG